MRQEEGAGEGEGGFYFCIQWPPGEPLSDDFWSAEACPFEAATYRALQPSQAIPGPESEDAGVRLKSSQERENGAIFRGMLSER